MGRVLGVVEPIGRATRIRMRLAHAERRATQDIDPGLDLSTVSPVFLVGCGRSGTTLLGRLLSLHPEAHYLMEPYHYWAAVDPRTDASHVYGHGPGLCIMDETHVSDSARDRFERIFLTTAARSGARLLIEKTPINSYRLAWLDQLAPTARYIVLVRDGVDVAHSIGRLAARQHARISGRPKMNFWWGVANAKWSNLSRDGAAVNCIPDEVAQLETDEQKGAYEWILSHHEIARQRGKIDGRLLSLSYSDLVERPIRALSSICEFIGATASDDWLFHCSREIESGRGTESEGIVLPARMAEAFNQHQESFGFSRRARIASLLPS